ncbi:sensor histidine kinase [Paenibacillus planticolens]|uniref:Heme sensor protein HssS n=1 Tax=Paenibacillus planticolens TaxID=2654976 RepID=A0ABX1ZSH2_9BACL|nr:HAMP domain-containing sensor histidine kinase [Paenibacillus planticolens]NOV02593.1 GHKL domain-containing protein [Paenibacillus planticolens]
MSLGKRVRGTLFALGIFILIILYWLAVFYATEWIFTYMNKRPPEVVVQLINCIGGMFLWGITMACLGRFFRSEQMKFFQSLIHAIRSMSRGDFNVFVDSNPHNGPFVELVDSINNMAVELGQLEKMRQEFISNVSHEIQSPLTSISGFSRALQNEMITPAERKHYLEIIEAESTRLSKLSDNLLKLSSLESQHHPFEPKSYRLDKQIRNHILACEVQWVEKNIEMDIELEPVTLIADEDLLGQVWTNLIHNAIKFTPVGGTIGVHATSNRKEAIIRISNNGACISEEDLPHIFERFYKADKSRNRASGGNGLGLSIVKKIIDMHAGTISVESKPEEMTTFIVRLSLPE